MYIGYPGIETQENLDPQVILPTVTPSTANPSWSLCPRQWLERCWIKLIVPVSSFSKAFDIDMCPLPFMLDKMYHFVEVRFGDSSAYVQEQALQWLQVKFDFIWASSRENGGLQPGMTRTGLLSWRS